MVARWLKKCYVFLVAHKHYYITLLAVWHWYVIVIAWWLKKKKVTSFWSLTSIKTSLCSLCSIVTSLWSLGGLKKSDIFLVAHRHYDITLLAQWHCYIITLVGHGQSYTIPVFSGEAFSCNSLCACVLTVLRTNIWLCLPSSIASLIFRGRGGPGFACCRKCDCLSVLLSS